MAKSRRVCKLCRERPAAVPDRGAGSLVWHPVICAECHAERLRGDLIRVVTTKGEGSR